MKKVLHVTRGWLAGVASNIDRAVSYYHPGEYSFKWIPVSLYTDDLITFNYRVAEADIIHWHNWIDYRVILGTGDKTKHIIHYHSEPMNTDIVPPSIVKEKLPQVKQLVVAQYHAALDYYKNCQPIRNVVYIPDSWVDRDILSYIDGKSNKLKLGFSPSSGNSNIWQNKDYKRHIKLINRVSQQLKGYGVDLDLKLIMNKPYKLCIWEKSQCDVILDECVTPSFHLSSLEGLALGKMTICWVDEKVNNVINNVTGAGGHPFHGEYIGWLEDILLDRFTRGPGYIKKQGELAYEWYEKYWNPRDVAADYHNMYSNL